MYQGTSQPPILWVAFCVLPTMPIRERGVELFRCEKQIHLTVDLVWTEARMTHRERLLMALDHRSPDRVPMDLIQVVRVDWRRRRGVDTMQVMPSGARESRASFESRFRNPAPLLSSTKPAMLRSRGEIPADDLFWRGSVDVERWGAIGLA